MYIQQTKQWIESFVIGLNLCPFAQHEIDNNSLRLQVSNAVTQEEGLKDFMAEIAYLDSVQAVGTTLLLFPHGLNDFFEYLDFVELVNDKLLQVGYEGIYQLATFHPAYCFHGTNNNDVTNYTNRSPYPMIHILRESMLDAAIAYYGDTETIPENNMICLQKLGLKEVKQRLQAIDDC